MEYLINDFQIIEESKITDKDLINQNLSIKSKNFIANINEKLTLLNELQFKLFLTEEVDKLFKLHKSLKNKDLKNTIIRDMYVQSYLFTYKEVELKYKPHIKEAFKEFYEFWDNTRHRDFDRTVWKNIMYEKHKETIKPIEKNKKSKWEYVFELIVKGDIIVNDEKKHNLKFYFKDKEFKNKTELGNYISETIDLGGNFRPYFSDSIGNGGTKNILTSKNLIKLNKIISENENKMCPYFQKKYDELISEN